VYAGRFNEFHMNLKLVDSIGRADYRGQRRRLFPVGSSVKKVTPCAVSLRPRHVEREVG